MLWIIVGLGNPDRTYEQTRHNTGRDAVRLFGLKAGFGEWKENAKAMALVAGDKRMTLVLPNTYMNKSGNAVAHFVKAAKAAERLVVIHDDLDLPVGKIKISFGRGSGGHKGVESVMRAIKTKKFVRVRIGVSPVGASGKTKKPQGEKEVENFILSKFKSNEQVQLKKVLKQVSEVIAVLVKEGRERAMGAFN